VTAAQGDIANLADPDRLYETVKKEKGALDIVVANAAVVEMVTLADATPEHFDRTFNVNARGTFFTVQKALPLLRKGGAVVLVSSAVHLIGIPVFTAYAATKAALRSFTRSWAAELKDRGIRVNCLSPGGVDTPILDSQFKTKEEANAFRAAGDARVPLGRIGQPDEIAAAILFLASSDSSYSTGIDLIADGGITQTF
jgi:NAD(P)-dependent dehydrogenase (short-subunit alcohol dehydrogenase family)